MALSPTEAYFVTRTVRALELLASGPLTAPKLAEAMQIHPRTARRMLNRLADEGYVARLDESRHRYVLTMRLVALAGQWLHHSENPDRVIAAAPPEAPGSWRTCSLHQAGSAGSAWRPPKG